MLKAQCYDVFVRHVQWALKAVARQRNIAAPSGLLLCGALVAAPSRVHGQASLAQQSGYRVGIGARPQSSPASGALPSPTRLGPRDTVQMARQIGARVRIGYVTALLATDRDIVLGDIQYSPHLAVLDRSTGQLTARLGPDGTHAGELREPSCVTPVQRDAEAIWVFDRGRSILTRIRLFGAQDPMGNERRLGNLGPITLCAAWVTGGLVVHNYTPEYLRMVDSAGNAGRAIAVPPPFKEHEDLDHSAFASSPDGRHMALAYEYANRIDLLDGTGAYIALVRGPQPIEPPRYEITQRSVDTHSHAFVSAESDAAYLALAATNDRVYALFSGCSGDCSVSGTQVQVFGWNGEFQYQFAVDRKLLRIAVSPDDGALYGVIYNPERGGYGESLGEWILPRRP